MWASNEALTDDPNKDPEPFQSQPWQWPILYRGLRIVNWADDKIKYFMFGNPIVWWGGFASLLGIVVFWVLGFVAQSRGWASTPDAAEQDRYWFGGFHICLLGWALHYFPFYLMRRVLYLHHYHPALYFAILAFAFVYDTVVKRYVPKRLHNGLWVGFIVVVLAFWWFFKDFALGLQGPAGAYSNRKWFSTWDM